MYTIYGATITYTFKRVLITILLVLRWLKIVILSQFYGRKSQHLQICATDYEAVQWKTLKAKTSPTWRYKIHIETEMGQVYRHVLNDKVPESWWRLPAAPRWRGWLNHCGTVHEKTSLTTSSPILMCPPVLAATISNSSVQQSLPCAWHKSTPACLLNNLSLYSWSQCKSIQ